MVYLSISYRTVYVGRFEEMLPGELLPALIPEAKVIILVSSLRAGLKEIKVRAGLKFPIGVSLNMLGLLGYGGRWNAGSTKRCGGTPEGDVDAFIAHLIKIVAYRLILHFGAMGKISQFLISNHENIFNLN